MLVWLVSSTLDFVKVVHGLRIQQVCLVNANMTPGFQEPPDIVLNVFGTWHDDEVVW